MTYDEAVAYLETFTNYERLITWPAQRSFRLDRMAELLRLLGDPHRRYRSLLVAGTKGKGSTCALLYGILGQLGQPVGLYTSPHLVCVRERLRVHTGVTGVEGEDWIAERDFAALVRQAQSAIDAVHHLPALGGLTYFEVLTALAFLHFANRRVAYAVLEVGLGGRLDATNVVTPDVCVLTPVSLDHTDVLGASVRDIAAQKAGIIKPRVPVVVARQPPEAQEAIATMADLQHAPVRLEGRDFHVEDVHADRRRTRTDVIGWFGAYRLLDLPLLGAHQAQNAALAVAAVEVLRAQGLPLTPEAVRDGLRQARWPGRCELPRQSPWVLLDGAQNVASAEALAATVRALFPETQATVILGVSQPKDAGGIVRALAPIAQTVLATQAEHPRAYPVETLVALATAAGVRAAGRPRVSDALAAAVRAAGTDGLIVVTGSLFVVGEARAWLTAGGTPVG